METQATDLRTLIRTACERGTQVMATRDARRRRLATAAGEVLIDELGNGEARCLFWRSGCPDGVRIRLSGAYRMTTVQAGGWLLLARAQGQASYWLPAPPTLRRIDNQGRILQESDCPLRTFEVDENGVEVDLFPSADSVLDLVIWEIDAASEHLAADLARLEPTELQPVFLWGSHGTYRRPADLYRHLIQGNVFDLRFAWPHKRRACSENEAHALHLALRNREITSSKAIYRRLRDQVLLSVLARQEADGAWRHGIWTGDMECHFRLHCSALHMLMDCYSEQPDNAVLAALKAGTDFIADQATLVLGKTWFLHDSLEQNETAISQALAGWTPCSNPGKSASNTLVLNTHIDTLIALHRFSTITGDDIFADRISSARELLEQFLKARPAERLYRFLMRPLYLTLLPAEKARALSLPKRALKRLARERFLPWLTRLKCQKPRFVMPEGYLDRVIGIRGFAHPYHSINLMDLVRYRRSFPASPGLDEIIDNAIAFVQAYDLLQHWYENPAKRHGAGFWLEALYQLCLLRSNRELRQLLAESAIHAERNHQGLPPSLAGNNLEALPSEPPHPCPAPPETRLRVINLSRARGKEYLVVNPAVREVVLTDWISPWNECSWTASDGSTGATADMPPLIPPGGWLLCKEPPARRGIGTG